MSIYFRMHEGLVHTKVSKQNKDRLTDKHLTNPSDLLLIVENESLLVTLIIYSYSNLRLSNFLIDIMHQELFLNYYLRRWILLVVRDWRFLAANHVDWFDYYSNRDVVILCNASIVVEDFSNYFDIFVRFQVEAIHLEENEIGIDLEQ